MSDPVKIKLNDKEIIFVGTAHVSKVSALQVKEVIDQYQPDTVCIELDEQRFKAMQDPEKWRNTDIVEIIKSGRAGYLLANIILSSYQRKMAKQMEVSTGAEMMQGIDSAQQINAEISLVDRNVQTTFKRIWRTLGFTGKIKLLFLLISAIFDDEEVTEEDLEQLKQEESLDAALKEVTKQFPSVAKVLVTERDQILAHKIKNSSGNKIVAILGAAHIPGVLKHIEQDYDIEELETVPEPTVLSKSLKWAIPLLIIALILSSFTKDTNIGMNQIKMWVLWNGSLSALGTLLVKGHPLSILVAFIASPITSLNPLLAAGWFAGLTEAWIRKPKVSDFEDISEDVSTFKGFFTNKVTRILLVVIAANLFSTLGTVIGSMEVVKSFFNLFF